ncbi:leukocyte receptor cluster member 1 homolog [Sitodiplosis mosellana]|uniref:leukocyte receptor cluster member 1 homolog n=1 Tax=Sitodiplosis mosellana TaxID=263140 RepID=UPI0024439BCB|nr:leukocyte receptor cluster member 1 homolog [Sitodiplosis mosellana]
MNILPHKSWHVRTKANIAKVRKDQAKAAEEEAEKQRRVAVADYEARISLLRNRAKQTPTSQAAQETSLDLDGETQPVSASEHIDLFSDHEDKQKKVKPMDEEKRQEQEKYEKQIGYLTYLGQDTHEAMGTRSWYNSAPKRNSESVYDESGEKVEIGLKVKHLHDPMMQFLTKKKPITVDGSKMGNGGDSKSVNIDTKPIAVKAMPTILEKPMSRKRSTSPERKHKKSKSSKRSKEKKVKKNKKKKYKKEKRKRRHSSASDSSSDSESEQLRQHKMLALQQLREERLQRERQEHEKTKELLRKKCPSLLPPEELKKPEEVNTEPRMPAMKQKYNSQFNPYLAKQNYG